MKRIFFFLSLIVLAALACSLPATEIPSAETLPTEAATQPEVQNEAGEAVLYFTIGMHIEPMGETAQGYGAAKPIITPRNSSINMCRTS